MQWWVEIGQVPYKQYFSRQYAVDAASAFRCVWISLQIKQRERSWGRKRGKRTVRSSGWMHLSNQSTFLGDVQCDPNETRPFHHHQDAQPTTHTSTHHWWATRHRRVPNVPSSATNSSQEYLFHPTTTRRRLWFYLRTRNNGETGRKKTSHRLTEYKLYCH